MCVDVHDLDDGCSPGKYCTEACQSDTDCATTGSAGYCETVLGQSACFYMPWLTAHGCS